MRRILLAIGIGLCALIAWAWVANEPRREPVAGTHDELPSTRASVASIEPDAHDLDAALPAAAPRLDARDEEPKFEPEPRTTTHEYQLVNGLTREPLAGFVLRVRGGALVFDVTTAEDGGFELRQPALVDQVVELAVGGADPTRRDSWVLSADTVYVRYRRSEEVHVLSAFARAPSIELEVQDERGAPVRDAVVWLHAASDTESPASRRTTRPRARRSERTDEHGRVRFTAFEDDASSTWIAFVDDEKGMVSTPIVLRAPRAPDHVSVLRTTAAGTISARVVDAHERALPDFTVTAALAVEDFTPIAMWDRATARTAVESRPLPPGDYRMRANHVSGQPVVIGDVVLRPASNAVATLVVDGELPERAVSGVVLDEDGHPLAGLALKVFPRESNDSWVFTQADGTFVAWRKRCERVTVAVGVGADSDVFEPSVAQVDFGSENVVFRRTAVVPFARVWIRPIDARTRAPLLDARLCLLRTDSDLSGQPFFVDADGRMAARMASWWRQKGLAFDDLSEDALATRTDMMVVTAKLQPTMRWRMEAPGHARAEGSVADWMAASNGAQPIEIALQPGFEASIHLIDKDTREPIDGVRCIDAQELTLVTISDARGVVSLSGVEPPAHGFLLEHSDYYTGSWDPGTRWSDTGVIEMWRKPH